MPTFNLQNQSPASFFDKQADWRREKLDAIRNYNAQLIADLGIAPSDFNMKMAFYNSKGDMVVGIFASEFKKEKGFFFELVTRDLNPATIERAVYIVPPSSSFHDEYELNEKGSYLVPLEELRIVNPQSVALNDIDAIVVEERPKIKDNTVYKAPAPMEDAPYKEMTIRDYFAIHTGKPVSSRNWLNELIKTTK